MAVTLEEEIKAELVVEESRRTARVETGALKRSINYTIARGQIVFRQFFYGVENDNSQLVENAKKMMGETPYTIELIDEEGRIKEVITIK